MDADYLRRLPPEARPAGSAAAGEIELITDPAAAAAVAESRRRRMAGEGFPDSGELGIVFEDEYVLLVRDAVRFPSGATGTYLRVVERAGLAGPTGAVIVATRGGHLYLRHVYRHATRRWELECPRGFRSGAESGEAVVRREVAEELGIAPLRMVRLGEVVPNTGLLASRLESWFVALGDGEPDSRPDPSEAFGEIQAVPLGEVRRLVAEGGLRDGISLAAIFQAESLGHFRM